MAQEWAGGGFVFCGVKPGLCDPDYGRVVRMQSCSGPVDPRPLTLAKTRRVIVSGFGRIKGSPQGMMAGPVVKV